MGVELFSYVNIFVAHWVNVAHFVQRNLDERRETTHSSFDLFGRKKRWLLSKRRGYTTRSQTTAFRSYEKLYEQFSYEKFVKTCL